MASHMSSTTAPGPSLTRVATFTEASRFQSESKAAMRRLVPPRSMPMVSRPFFTFSGLINLNHPLGRFPTHYEAGRTRVNAEAKSPSSSEFYDTSSLFARSLEVLADPDKNLGKAKFMPGYRAVDKSVSTYPFYF